MPLQLHACFTASIVSNVIHAKPRDGLSRGSRMIVPADPKYSASSGAVVSCTLRMKMS